MPTETASGMRVGLHLPKTKWPELQQLAEEYAEKEQERKVVAQRLGSLQARGREAAKRQDALALAEAIEQGKKESAHTKVEQVDKEIGVCETRLEALEILADKLEQDLISLVDEHRDDWIEEVDAELTVDFGTYEEAIETVAEARACISQKVALRRWLFGFPETNAYKESGSSWVVALKAMHGDPYTFSQVMDALRQDAQTPPPDAARFKTSVQLRHEEAQRNLKAGRGYYTDADLQRRKENPIEFDHGRGAKIMRSFRVPKEDE